MYKVTGERSTSLTRDLKEENHISQFIILLDIKSESYNTAITKSVSRSSTYNVILFEVDKRTWWCKSEEFNIIKFALETFTSNLVLWYVVGSISPALDENKNRISRSSGIDGYELHLKFD